MRWWDWFWHVKPDPKTETPDTYMLVTVERRPLWNGEVATRKADGRWSNQRGVQRATVAGPLGSVPWWYWIDSGECVPANLDRMLDLRVEWMEAIRERDKS